MSYKSGFVTIIGRPNVGKSTLLNAILGQKIVIATEKPQTTRQRIKGILTEERGQIVFVDTPGVHKPKNKLGEYLSDEAKFAIPDADLILFLVDGSDPAGKGDAWIVRNLLETEIPIILVINKVDLVKSEKKIEANVQSYKDLMENKQCAVVKISAKTGRNFDTLTNNIFRKLPAGPQYYPDEQVTDQNMRQIAQELVREKVLLNTQEEIPHSIAVLVEKFEEQEKITKIAASIFVEQDSQKGILIGKKGQMLKKIGTEARLELEDMLETKVFLQLFVKVQKDWRKKQESLKSFGYICEN